MLKKLLVIMSCTLLTLANEVLRPIATPADPSGYAGGSVDTAIAPPDYTSSIRWSFDESPHLNIKGFPGDLLHFQGKNNAVEFWLFEEKPLNSQVIFLIYSDNPDREGADYYCIKVKLDFSGWKRFIVPFSDFSTVRSPLGWDKITDILFSASGWNLSQAPGSVLHVGRVALLDTDVAQGPRVTDGEFYQQLDLEQPSLENVKAAVLKGDYASAEHALAAYYRQRKSPRWRVMWDEMPAPDRRPANYDTSAADRTVRHLLTSVNVPHQFGERIDWSINPTKLKYNEWTWQLSRHPMWVSLQQAYWATGNETYAKEFNDQMVAWVEDNLCPLLSSGNSAWSRWRTIECGIRTAGSWPTCFFGFLSSPSFTDHGIVTMLKSFYEHAVHLRKHPTQGNWLTMEMNGLYTTATLFPEFKASKEWQQFAFQKLYDDMAVQIYPDGAQTELAPGYHGVSLNNFLGLVRIAAINGIQLPEEYLANLEKMYDYYVKIATPGLNLLPLNDSGWGSVVPTLATGFSYFPSRKSFQYFATKRQEGAKPEFTSVWMPYAGWAIMRSGWEADDNYLQFEVGPFGTAHQHEDKLSFVIHAKGSRLLTEGGVYPYDTSQWRKYVLSSYAHNITLVDSMEQHRRLNDRRFNKTEAPLPNVFITNEKLDFAEGWYDEGYGPTNDTTVTQYRAILFLKPECWVMVDIFTPRDDKPHTYETLFHLENAEAVKDEATLAVIGADAGRANLAIIPANPQGLGVEIVKGQEKPVVQGWVPAKGYDVRAIPTPVYTRTAAGQVVEPYLLYPLGAGEANPVKAISFRDGTLAIQMADGRSHAIGFAIQGGKLAQVTWNGTAMKIR